MTIPSVLMLQPSSHDPFRCLSIPLPPLHVSQPSSHVPSGAYIAAPPCSYRCLCCYGAPSVPLILTPTSACIATELPCLPRCLYCHLSFPLSPMLVLSRRDSPSPSGASSSFRFPSYMPSTAEILLPIGASPSPRCHHSCLLPPCASVSPVTRSMLQYPLLPYSCSSFSAPLVLSIICGACDDY